MELFLTPTLASEYKNNSQKARVYTEAWVEKNLFCPSCGRDSISHFPNNQPVADFYCPACHEEFELKSKSSKLAKKINDGAYSTMINRITSSTNPHFFLMEYSKNTFQVRNMLFIPNYFFTVDIIEKRNPLAQTAQRAGWIGCNILLSKIPLQGRIYIINEGQNIPKELILEQTTRSQLLKNENLKARGWLMDTLLCVNRIKSIEFCLSDIYKFEKELAIKHTNNNNIQAKIRQQLQYLRDKGYIEFLGKGRYKKIF